MKQCHQFMGSLIALVLDPSRGGAKSCTFSSASETHIVTIKNFFRLKFRALNTNFIITLLGKKFDNSVQEILCEQLLPVKLGKENTNFCPRLRVFFGTDKRIISVRNVLYY